MLRNYLKIAYRSLLRHKGFSFINVSGLAIGMAACLLILQYVRYERSYDSFHEKADRIYRVGVAWYHPNGELEEKLTGNFGAAGGAIKAEIPEVEAFARFRPWFGNTIVKHGGIALPQARIYFADPAVFTLFSFPVLRGDAHAGLNEPNSAVITESTARKYFGLEDPVGKVIELQQDSTARPVTVRAVVEDVPSNSHFQFEMLLSYRDLGEFAETDWGFSIVSTYLLVQAHTDPDVLQGKLQQVLQKHRETAMENSAGEVKFILQPLRDIYLYSDLRGESVPTGNGRMLYFISMIGVLILCIAYANYINLSTARAMERAREVGVRKVAGAPTTALVLQFLQESFILNGLSIIVAIAVTQILQQPFSLLTGQPASFVAGQPLHFWVLPVIFLVMGSLASGIYPAFVLSSFKPIVVLKGNFVRSARGNVLRKCLVVFQFAVSVGLIGITLMVHRQLSYMRNQELGVDIRQMAVIEAPVVTDPLFPAKAEAFKRSLMSIPGVVRVTASTEVPGRNITWSNDLIHRKGIPIERITSNYILGVDYDFIKTYDLKLVAGRDFDEAFGTDEKGLVINEKAARLMGFETPSEALGEPMVWDDEEGNVDYKIIGVVKNYHQLGLRHDYDPMILTLEHQQESFYSCKFEGGDPRQKLEAIERAYNRYFPGNPFDYFFLDEFFDRQYKADQRFGLVFLVFSGLAIFVACLGLYGLVTFVTSQRTKEIGIRKVLGASVQAIVGLLSRDFLKVVVVASVLSTPLTYVATQQWLKNYVFRMEIGFWMLLAPVATVMFIAVITVGFQAVHAALANPVKSLRYE